MVALICPMIIASSLRLWPLSKSLGPTTSSCGFFNSLLWLFCRKNCLGYAWISCRKGNVFILNKTPSGEVQFGFGLVYLILISVRVHLDPQPVMKSILCSQFWVIHKLITQVPSGLWVFKQCSIKPWVLCGRAESGRTGWVGRSVGERGSV